MKQIGINTQDANAERINTLQAVENISSASEETAAASSMVNEYTNEQLKTVDTLQEVSNDLNLKMQKLESAFSSFKIR